MPRIDFPRQKLSRRKKTQKWGEECIESALGLIGIYDHTRRSSRFKKKRNYDLYNGQFDKKDLEYVTDPLGLGGVAELPATLQYYDIVSPIFNLLFGEEAKRKFSYVVRSVNEDAITSKEEEMQNAVVDMFAGLINQYRDQASQQNPQASPEQLSNSIPENLKRLEKYFSYDFQDMNESVAHKLLSFLERDLDLKTMFRTGWEDALIAGEEIYNIEQVAQEPSARRVNPLEFYCLLPHNSDYVDDAEVIVEDTFMSLNTIIDNYYEDLTPAQIDKLEKEQGMRGSMDSQSILNYPTPEKLYIQDLDPDAGSDSNLFNYYDQDGNIRVTKITWKSMRKIGKLTYIDELGLRQETIVNESYKLDQEAGEEIEYMWVNEYWEGTKIGESTYVNIRPKRQQFRRMDNLSVCKSGYVGTVYNANNSQSVSLMDRLVPWVYLYITLWYRLELAISANQGKIALIDLSLVPDGWEVEKWMYYAQSMKFGFVDSFNEGKKGQSTGKLAGNISTQNKVLDMETGNYIQQHIQLLEFVESKVQSLSGVTRQRLGSITSSELVGTTERAVQQSSHITEKWYEIHNHTKVRVLQTLLDVAKDVYKGKTKKFQYVTDNLATMTFNLIGDKFGYSEYGVFVSNSTQDLQALEALKSLTQASLQNDKMSISDVISIYNSSSLSDIRNKIEQSEKEAEQRSMQMQEMQLQQAREQQQAQQEMEMAKLKFEQEKENREDARNTEDNRTKLEIAKMNNESKKSNEI
tara:strand:+ start:496 stop:2739 length:2244 start_codon:yes stop_codon:yes gene_type:complete